MMKFIFTVICSFLLLPHIGSAQKLKRLSVMEKASIFISATMMDSLFFGVRNLTKRKKKCVLVMRAADEFMIKDSAIKYGKQWADIISDYVVCDSLRRYREVDVIFITDSGHSITINYGFPYNKIVKRRYKRGHEYYTIAQKLDKLFYVSEYQNSGHWDTTAKALLFDRKVTSDWFKNSLAGMTEGTNRYAKLVYAYILRNRHEEFSTIVFDYYTEDTTQQPVRYVFTRDAPIFKGLQ